MLIRIVYPPPPDAPTFRRPEIRDLDDLRSWLESGCTKDGCFGPVDCVTVGAAVAASAVDPHVGPDGLLAAGVSLLTAGERERLLAKRSPSEFIDRAAGARRP